MKKIMLLALIGCMFGCGSNPVGEDTPPEVSVDELLSSPDTIAIEGRKISLQTGIWEDRMPTYGSSERKNFYALAYVNADGAAPISENLSADAIYLIRDNQVWKSFFKSDYRPSQSEQLPNQIVKFANGKPSLGVNIEVTAVVRLSSSQGNQAWLKAPRQYIGVAY